MAGAWALSACSSDSSTPQTPATTPDAGGTAESGGGTDSAAADSAMANDTGPQPVNMCTTFVDRTDAAASRKIQWDLAVVGIPERCMKIKAGQVVTWANGTGPADFNTHPLNIANQGAGASPVVDTATGNATFPAAGVFGFICEVHSQMRGAIVVE